MEVIIGCGASSVDLVDAMANVVSERERLGPRLGIPTAKQHIRGMLQGLPVSAARRAKWELDRTASSALVAFTRAWRQGFSRLVGDKSGRGLG